MKNYKIITFNYWKEYKTYDSSYYDIDIRIIPSIQCRKFRTPESKGFHISLSWLGFVISLHKESY